jgi:hypothetical protein
MNPRVTALLFLVAAALGAFVWFYEIEGEEARKASEDAAKRLFPELEADQISWIALTSSDGHPVRLERKEGSWRLVQPIEFRADGFVVDGMTSSLAQLASESSYAEPQPPEVYGLGEGAREVAFEAGGAERRLRIGARTPMGGNTYVSVGGSGPVYAVRTYSVSALAKRLDELRDKRIVEFATDAVRGLAVRWADGGVVVAREEGAGEAAGEAQAGEAKAPAAQWRLVEPIAGRADASTVDSALSNLSFLRATGFEDAAGPDAESGLERPELEIELTLAPESEGAEPRKISVAFGPPLASGDRLVRSGGPTLFRVPGTRIDDYPRKLVAWRFKDVARFAAENARRLEIALRDAAGGELLLTATRGENDEWSSAPEAMDPDRLRTLVDELARLRARDILADSMGPEELRGLALEPPNARFVVRGADEGSALAEVRLGVVRPGGGLVAQAAGNPMVFELDPVLAEYLPVGLDAFRSRFTAKPEAAEGEEDADAAPEAEAAGEEEPPEAPAPPAADPAAESP